MSRSHRSVTKDDRRERFSRWLPGPDEGKNTSSQSLLTKSGQPTESILLRSGPDFTEDGGYGLNMDIKGKCTNLEKNYFRLTKLPDPLEIRPLSILRKSFVHVMQKYRNQNKDYSYIISQLKSIRQDLTIQKIRNDFTVQVYEVNARLSLFYDDFNELQQCLNKLAELYPLVDHQYYPDGLPKGKEYVNPFKDMLESRSPATTYLLMSLDRLSFDDETSQPIKSEYGGVGNEHQHFMHPVMVKQEQVETSSSSSSATTTTSTSVPAPSPPSSLSSSHKDITTGNNNKGGDKDTTKKQKKDKKKNNQDKKTKKEHTVNSSNESGKKGNRDYNDDDNDEDDSGDGEGNGNKGTTDAKSKEDDDVVVISNPDSYYDDDGDDYYDYVDEKKKKPSLEQVKRDIEVNTGIVLDNVKDHRKKLGKRSRLSLVKAPAVTARDQIPMPYQVGNAAPQPTVLYGNAITSLEPSIKSEYGLPVKQENITNTADTTSSHSSRPRAVTPGYIYNKDEFICYRILCSCLSSKNDNQRTKELVFQSLTPHDLTLPSVKFALKLSSAIDLHQYDVFFQLYQCAPYLSRFIVKELLVNVRNHSLHRILVAFRTTISIDSFCKLLGYNTYQHSRPRPNYLEMVPPKPIPPTTRKEKRQSNFSEIQHRFEMAYRRYIETFRSSFSDAHKIAETHGCAPLLRYTSTQVDEMLLPSLYFENMDSIAAVHKSLGQTVNDIYQLYNNESFFDCLDFLSSRGIPSDALSAQPSPTTTQQQQQQQQQPSSEDGDGLEQDYYAKIACVQTIPALQGFLAWQGSHNVAVSEKNRKVLTGSTPSQGNNNNNTNARQPYGGTQSTNQYQGNNSNQHHPPRHPYANTNTNTSTNVNVAKAIEKARLLAAKNRTSNPHLDSSLTPSGYQPNVINIHSSASFEPTPARVFELVNMVDDDDDDDDDDDMGTSSPLSPSNVKFAPLLRLDDSDDDDGDDYFTKSNGPTTAKKPTWKREEYMWDPDMSRKPVRGPTAPLVPSVNTTIPPQQPQQQYPSQNDQYYQQQQQQQLHYQQYHQQQQYQHQPQYQNYSQPQPSIPYQQPMVTSTAGAAPSTQTHQSTFFARARQQQTVQPQSQQATQQKQESVHSSAPQHAPVSTFFQSKIQKQPDSTQTYQQQQQQTTQSLISSSAMIQQPAKPSSSVFNNSNFTPSQPSTSTQPMMGIPRAQPAAITGQLRTGQMAMIAKRKAEQKAQLIKQQREMIKQQQSTQLQQQGQVSQHQQQQQQQQAGASSMGKDPKRRRGAKSDDFSPIVSIGK